MHLLQIIIIKDGKVCSLINDICITMSKKYTALVVLNTITFLIMLFVNYASNAHMLAVHNIAEISYKYDTLFAPAGYAFTIWSVIYLLCAGFVIYQWMLLKNDSKQFIRRTGTWFIISNIANTLWCYCWVNEWLGLCVLLILLQLISLLVLVVKLRLELDDEPVRIIFFIWWPVCFYTGWMITATVACIASWLVDIGWNGFNISPATWTIIMITVAFVIYLWLTQKRNMREAATVGIWAFIAIAVRQWNANKNIAVAAIIACVLLSIFIAVHAYKNKIYSPGAKIKRGEWK